MDNILPRTMQEIILWIAKRGEFESKDIRQFYCHSYNIYNALNKFAKAGMIEKSRKKGKIKLTYRITHKGMVFADLLSSLDPEISREFETFLEVTGISIHYGVVTSG